MDVPRFEASSTHLFRPGVLRRFELVVDEWTYVVGLNGPETDAVECAIRLDEAGWLSPAFFELVEKKAAVFLLWVDGWWEIYSADAAAEERLRQAETVGTVESSRWETQGT